MRRSVLADTGPLYAAVDIDDSHHARAQDELARLGRERFQVVVLSPILSEAYTLILHRLGLPIAHRWLRDMSAGASLLNPTADDFTAAMTTVQAYDDQPVTLFDAVLAAVSRRLHILVWSYDHHFEVLRTDIWR